MQPSAGDDGPHDLYRYFGRVAKVSGWEAFIDFDPMTAPPQGAYVVRAHMEKATASGREWIHAGEALVRARKAVHPRSRHS